MPYGPNTSRINRLPHGFFERMYEDISIAEDTLNEAEDHPPNPDEVLAMMAILRRMAGNLRRQRESHLGNESL